MSKSLPKQVVETQRGESFRRVSTPDVSQTEIDFPPVRVVEVDEQRESYEALRRDVCSAVDMVGGNKDFASATGRSKSDVSRCLSGLESRNLPIEFLDDLAFIKRDAFEYVVNRLLRRHGYGPIEPIRVATPEEKFDALRRAVDRLGPAKQAVLEAAAQIAGLDVESFE